MSLSGAVCLVTGGGGFIGSHLVEELIRQGATARAFVHYNSRGTRGWLDQSELADRVSTFAGDLADRDSLREAMHGVDVVFHLGALIAIPYSYAAPESYVRTNVMGTLNVLQAAREFGASRVVHTSTSEVYGTARTVPISEEHALQGQSPYSASKIGADKIAESVHLSFELPVVTLRPFNTYGPRQSARAVIPTVIAQCLSDSPRLRLGNLTPTRDFNYVADTVRGFLLAATAPDAVGQTINLGSGREISIGDLARLIAELTGADLEIEVEERRLRPENSEVERLLADNRRAHKLLGWQPGYSLEEGLRETIAWVEANLGWYRPAEYTV